MGDRRGVACVGCVADVASVNERMTQERLE